MTFRLAYTTTAVIGLALISAVARADATPADWIGDWKLNHDGHLGTLVIRQAAKGWIISYQPKGKQCWYVADEPTLSDKGQHLSLTFNFDGNRQPFDLYIFSWDKHSLGGTTVWSNRTFGVSGTLMPPPLLDAKDCGESVHKNPRCKHRGCRIIGWMSQAFTCA